VNKNDVSIDVRGREIVLRAHKSALRRRELDRHARVVVVVVVVIKKHERNARARGSGTHTKKEINDPPTHTHNTLTRENKKEKRRNPFLVRAKRCAQLLFGQKTNEETLSPLERDRERALQNKKRSNAHLTYLLVRMCFYKNEEKRERERAFSLFFFLSTRMAGGGGPFFFPFFFVRFLPFSSESLFDGEERRREKSSLYFTHTKRSNIMVVRFMLFVFLYPR